MKFAFFTIPLHGHGEETDALNRFLDGHRIVNIEKTFVTNGSESAWSFCISYEPSGERPTAIKRGKIDYREVLSEPEFQIYAKLRSLRKSLAAEEGVPPYALFNNQQLAEMMQHRIDSEAGMREIDGVGNSRVEKYGPAFLKVLSEEFPGLGTPKAIDDEA